jgi:hypothetical protein
MAEEIEELRARVAELERRVEILFSNTRAIDMATTMGALGKLRP